MDRTLNGRTRSFRELIEERRGLLDPERYEPVVERIVRALVAAFAAGRKVLWCGNGGSAADAQHLAAEFSGRFLLDRRALPSEALTVNTSALTAIANDFGYERVFARQVEAFAVPGDVVIGISTSGNSPSVVAALEEARARGATAIAFSGNGGGKLAEAADIALVGPDGYAALVQEVHIALGHIVCDLVEQALFTRAHAERGDR
ncbi:MAG: D-sedoheptulose-7-phosphate isomerase [Vulcanimicrobiaceae bacterium]